MYFVVSHICREENYVADKLANLGLDINDSLWFDSCSIVFRSDLVSTPSVPFYKEQSGKKICSFL
jgi:hypothetical protein